MDKQPQNTKSYVDKFDIMQRCGQKNACSHIHFITKDTIEGAIYKALKGYSDFREKLFTEYMQEYTRSYSGGR